MRRLWQKIKRAYDYAVFGWSNYDWDYGYMYELLQFKLERMEAALKGGVAIQSKESMKSLRVCIKLLKRINRDSYNYNTELHYKKWGEPKISFLSEIGSDYSKFVVEHENVKTPEDKVQEHAEIKEAIRKDVAQENRDKRLLFRIMEKYSNLWWD